MIKKILNWLKFRRFCLRFDYCPKHRVKRTLDWEGTHCEVCFDEEMSRREQEERRQALELGIPKKEK